MRDEGAIPGNGAASVPSYRFASPGWAVAALLAGLLLTAVFGWREWISERERVQLLQRSLAVAQPARSARAACRMPRSSPSSRPTRRF